MKTGAQKANEACGMAFDYGRREAEFEAYSVAMDAALEGRVDAAAIVGRFLVEVWRDRWPYQGRKFPTEELNAIFKRIYAPMVEEQVAFMRAASNAFRSWSESPSEMRPGYFDQPVQLRMTEHLLTDEGIARVEWDVPVDDYPDGD